MGPLQEWGAELPEPRRSSGGATDWADFRDDDVEVVDCELDCEVLEWCCDGLDAMYLPSYCSSLASICPLVFLEKGCNYSSD